MTSSGSGFVMKTLPDVPVRRKSCRYGALCKRTDCRYYHEHRKYVNLAYISLKYIVFKSFN